MLQTKDEIITHINAGTLLEYRQPNLELKQNWHQSDGKKLSAFANRILDNSIWLCVGITDSGKLFGHDENWAKQAEETISNHMNQYLNPQATCIGVTCHEINGQWFIIIECRNPGAVVYWGNSAYKSSGTTIAEMAPAEIMQLTVSLPGLSDYTAQQAFTSYEPQSVRELADLISKRSPKIPITTFDNLSPQDILARLGINDTNASRILFGDSKYRVVYYDAYENPVENKTFAGMFGILKASFAEHVQEWTRTSAGLDRDPYPPRALKEALANAVAHAAYVEKDGDIIVELFLDRLCVSNVCMRESEFFANKWFSRSHNTINSLMMETLRMAGFVDELGRGKNLIFADSLKSGKQPPHVVLETGGRYDRWRLYLYGGTQDTTQLRILNRLKEMYRDEQKALIANALVLWRGQSVSSIRHYIDGESLPLFAEVLSDLGGPIFYYKEKDKIVLHRWVSVLIGEGKDSKQLSDAEEEDLLDSARRLQLDYNHGYITPKELRELAGMGHTRSEQVLSSTLLKKWDERGFLKKTRKGVYQFHGPKRTLTHDQVKEALQSLLADESETT